MSPRAAPRVLVLTGVAVIHAGALLLFLSLTRTQLIRIETESPMLVVLLQPEVLQHPARGDAVPRAQAPRPSAASAGANAEALPPAAAAPATAIDWAAEVASAASRQSANDRERRRQATALAPPPSTRFATRPKPPPFPWDSSRTQRLDGFPVFATVIHLNERCTLVLFVIFPMAGCALGEIPAHGALFEHMHDPEDPDGLP
jgi:hypothetical protein